MSTAFMIMSINDIAKLCYCHNFVTGMVVLRNISEVSMDDIFISNNFNIEKLKI